MIEKAKKEEHENRVYQFVEKDSIQGTVVV